MTVSVRIRAMTVVAMANLESILDQIASKKKKKITLTLQKHKS